MKEQNLYIAYGSNLNVEEMAKRCPTAKVLIKSKLKDYKIVFRGEKNNALATIEYAKNGEVPVLIWTIEDEDEKELDIYEEYPKLYEKHNIEVDIDGIEKIAMVYIMNDGNKLNEPEQKYLNWIKVGYQTFDFDANILQKALNETKQNMNK